MKPARLIDVAVLAIIVLVLGVTSGVLFARAEKRLDLIEQRLGIQRVVR